MKLLDANILLYAYDMSATHHEACRVAHGSSDRMS